MGCQHRLRVTGGNGFLLNVYAKFGTWRYNSSLAQAGLTCFV